MRRSLAALDGRVGRRCCGGGAIAFLTMATRRASAAVRFRSWERCSDAATVSTPSTSRVARRSVARSRCTGDSAEEAVRSQDSSTRESDVLTDCPPGPPDRENRQRSSDPGITREPRTGRSLDTGPACPDVAAAPQGGFLAGPAPPSRTRANVCRARPLGTYLPPVARRATTFDGRRVLPAVRGVDRSDAEGRSGGPTAGAWPHRRRPRGQVAPPRPGISLA